MEGGQAVSGVNISICDGKYTVIQAPTGTTRVLRYGEEWRDVTGDNVIGGLAWELQEARERIKRLEEDLMDAKNQYAVLVADVALYEDRGERIKRLEESENRMLNWLTEDCPESVKKQLSNAWMKSKEAKP
jgi:hypothetical protein